MAKKAKRKRSAPRRRRELTQEEFDARLVAAGATTYEPTPEEWKAFKEKIEKQPSAEEMEKARAAIARSIAIRDGLIPPPWLEKLIVRATSPPQQQHHQSDAGSAVEQPAATAWSPPLWGRERKLRPRERAKLMIADRKLFPKGTADYSSIKAVHRELMKHCKAHNIKPWEDDTTRRAMNELK